MNGCECRRAPMCDQCVADGFAQLRGVAQCRGERWAWTVAERVARRDPWPPHTGKAAAIARRKVADLADDPRLLELLAAELARAAARRWRAAGSAGFTTIPCAPRVQLHRQADVATVADLAYMTRNPPT